MDLTLWHWAILLAGAAVVFRLGMWFGRGVAEAERIRPISPTRIPSETRARIDDALRRGDKIGAIRLLRDETGCGLAEAKKTVDAMLPPEA